MDALEIFLICTPGLERQVEAEAAEAGFDVGEVIPGGVTIQGHWPDVWRANLALRGPTRVLVRVAAFRAMHLAQLDKRARKLPWTDWLAPDVPVSVEATCRKSRIYHAKAAAQRIEGALLATGYTLDRESGVRVKLRIEDDLATLSLDTSGASLHKRGLKAQVNKAPMRETLAAMFLHAAGYDGTETLVDPMCGSGTFVIEAAEMALGLLPGRARSFDFERFASFDPDAFEKLKSTETRETDVRVFGFDRDAGAIAMSERNADRAGVTGIASFQAGAIGDLMPPDAPPGLVMTNPPYGGRIGKQGALRGLYGTFGKAMRERFQGWRVGLVTSDGGLARTTGLDWDKPGPIVDHGGTKVRLWQIQL
ncbi:MAG: class I SAM-dependent RNA methyltransferase [Paracoccaceae bacterium]|nr:class I SAM-dependent RNA methyltransferase [Paracoccaceae bacterium]